MHGPQGAELDAQTARLNERMSKITYKILVMSGKGGVGKTTVSVNLALSLAKKGYKVGILDTDLHGPNVAKMLGAQGQKMYSHDEDTIEPFEVSPNLKAVSLAFAGNDDDSPVIWRGPLKINVIKQFLADVNWGTLDYLIIDSPPGTGDEPLTVCQMIPELTGSIVVTTPQEVSILDSRKSINFSRQIKVALLGVIENMSGFSCPHCGEVIDIFGKGGGQKAAQEMGAPFLGSIPIEKALMEAEDQGVSYVDSAPESASAQAIMAIVDKIEATLSSSR
jgi:ATP-binding protein involved in chromosome partitioning